MSHPHPFSPPSHPLSPRFQQFPPGHYYDSKTREFTRYYNPQFYLDAEAQPPVTPSTPYDPTVGVFGGGRGVLMGGGGIVHPCCCLYIFQKPDSPGTCWGRMHSFRWKGVPPTLGNTGVAASLYTSLSMIFFLTFPVSHLLSPGAA